MFKTSIISYFRNGFNFKDSASRTQYLKVLIFFVLFACIIGFFEGILEGLLNIKLKAMDELFLLLELIIFFPSFALTSRRLS